MKNWWIRLLTPKQCKRQRLPRRILVVTTTALGDTLWATPIIRALKESGYFLAVLTSPLGKIALENNPYIDRMIVAKRRLLWQWPTLFYHLIRLEIDTIFFFHATQRLIFPLCLALRPVSTASIREQNKGLDDLMTHLIDKEPEEHEIAKRLRLVRTICPDIRSNEEIEIYLTDAEISHAKERLSNASFPIVMHAGSKDLFKRWPPEFFKQLGHMLIAQGATLFLTGSLCEKPLTMSIAAGLPRTYDVAGILSLREQMALISQSRLLVTNDTGPMHVGFAFHIPTAAFFAVTDPCTCGPHKSLGHKIFTAPLCCTPCLGKRCRDPLCLRQITPHAVMEALAPLMTSEYLPSDSSIRELLRH